MRAPVDEEVGARKFKKLPHRKRDQDPSAPPAPPSTAPKKEAAVVPAHESPPDNGASARGKAPSPPTPRPAGVCPGAGDKWPCRRNGPGKEGIEEGSAHGPSTRMAAKSKAEVMIFLSGKRRSAMPAGKWQSLLRQLGALRIRPGITGKRRNDNRRG